MALDIIFSTFIKNSRRFISSSSSPGLKEADFISLTWNFNNSILCSLSISDDDLDELLFDDDVLEENDNSDSNNDDVIDIQKELEAKFDELFGSDSDN